MRTRWAESESGTEFKPKHIANISVIPIVKNLQFLAYYSVSIQCNNQNFQGLMLIYFSHHFEFIIKSYHFKLFALHDLFDRCCLIIQFDIVIKCQTDKYYNGKIFQRKLLHLHNTNFDSEMFCKARSSSNVSSDFGEYEVHSSEYAEYYKARIS